jgi:flagellin
MERKMVMSGISALNNLNRAHNTTMSSMQKIATGSQHPSASYGPSDYAISQRMNSNIGAIQQSNQNTQTSNAMLNVASGAIKNTVDALSSLKENILNAMNGTNTDSDRGALQKTVDQTVAQINDNASVTFNGKSLLDGGRTATVAGVIGNTQISFGDMTAQGLGLVDENGNSNLDLSTEEGMQNALATVDNALSIANEGQQQISVAQNGGMDFESALDEATTIGAQQQRLEYQAANYATMQENMAAADATMDGTDMAAEITKLRSAQTQEQLAMYGVQMYNQNRANILNLLP